MSVIHLHEPATYVIKFVLLLTWALCEIVYGAWWRHDRGTLKALPALCEGTPLTRDRKCRSVMFTLMLFPYKNKLHSHISLLLNRMSTIIFVEWKEIQCLNANVIDAKFDALFPILEIENWQIVFFDVFCVKFISSQRVVVKCHSISLHTCAAGMNMHSQSQQMRMLCSRMTWLLIEKKRKLIGRIFDTLAAPDAINMTKSGAKISTIMSKTLFRFSADRAKFSSIRY